ncbi:signal transduction histidine kinase/CheY-like chemotaxis protein/HPt (histidine-containing phosphotransfer) domain-containing protein [Methylobacterium sp. PvP062]|uniref:histidine kinase n=3 Tax=Methylobacterium TaxID=407 RepID=A0ABV2NPW1_9HYPH|nr:MULTISPECIES: ATP-binding protein [unclassified Methylobacterium]MBP2494764.1 two-component system sensor histidine kinase BarA [Methylobacterium sp. PvP105]MBP2505365.1 two-component system sensor histidine kinase BarA [Methylobacterium sp. PvP109]MCX7334713.1 ATP-binding protein [Hyphomicrobiales bacterium]
MHLAWLRPRRSLAGRLALAVTGAVTAALVLAAALSVWREVARYAADKQAALEAVAQVFAHGGARATAAGDADGADASLRAIGKVPSIVYGAIERLDGSVLAEQGIGLRLTRDAAQDGADLSLLHLLATRSLQATAPIVENGLPVGRVVLIGETDDILGHIWAAAQNAALAALLAVAIGVGVSLYLQRSVTRPLAALARTMEAARLRHDYAQRAPVGGDDEVGALARTFNDLLSAVNERDHRLAAHSAHLEAEVSARTADLSEAKQVADAANAAKSAFLATMSHEIRTPMNGVLVMAELLAGSDLPARQRRYAEVIARSGRSLLAIINDILDFAKVEAGKLELERVPVSPAELADTAVTLFAERARTAGLDLAAEVAPEVPRAILGDPVRLGQVLSNFVSNALKFTEAGHVSVRMAIDAGDGCLVIAVSDTGIGIPQDKLATIFSAFSQADQSTTRRFGGTGLGLSIAQQIVAAMGGTVAVTSRVGAGSTFSARIPVTVAEPARPVRRREAVPAAIVLDAAGPATRAALAAGLGAAGFAPVAPVAPGSGTAAHWIGDAAALVAAGRRPDRAGRVLAVAGPGDGAADAVLSAGLADAVLRWPVTQAEWQPVLAALAAGDALAASAPSAATAATAEALPQFPAARVLVADDSAVNCEVAREALARCGVTDVVTVEDGAAAVAAAAARHFDLILMDGSMPVLDGFAAARRIRQREATAGGRVPIVALTAHVLGEAADAAVAAGMDGTLLKPFTLRQLADLLQAQVPALRGAPADAPARTGTPESVGPVAAPPEAADDLLDAEVLDGLLGLGDGAFLDRVLDLYRAQGPVALAHLRAALAASDQPAIARAAHSLKSMSANVGARALVARLRVIEEAARSAACAERADACDALDRLFTATIRGLEERTRPRAAAA